MAEWTKWEVERAIVSGLAFGFSIAFSSIIVLLFFFDLFSRFSVDALPRFSPSSHPHIPFAYSPLFIPVSSPLGACPLMQDPSRSRIRALPLVR